MKQFGKLMLIALGFGTRTTALSLVPSSPWAQRAPRRSQ
jgi:hypothetical protein